MAFLEREAVGGDVFDRANLKRGVWEAARAGRAQLVCKELAGHHSKLYARVIILLPPGEPLPNWDLWARVFQWFGPAAAATTDATAYPFRVYLLASPADRESPRRGQDLGPEHVNGGYTRPCSTEGIVIYRSEESTRVLVHEMLHAACLDEASWPVEQREAMIETWAELILVALLSKGSAAAAAKLWSLQSQWVANTNWRVRRDHGVADATDYAWRYLCGREEMYQRLGVALPAPQPAAAARETSLRFTHPQLGP